MNIMKKAFDSLSNRKIRMQSRDKRSKSMQFYAVGSVLMLIAISIVFNLLFDIFINNEITIDFSDAQMSTIGSKTKEVLAQIDENVEIIGLFEKPDKLESSIYKFFIPLLNQYAAASKGKLSVRYVDPIKQPSILTSIDPESGSDLSQDTFIVKYKDDIRVIKPYDCFNFDPYLLNNYDQYSPIANNIEMIFTGTIMSLLKGETKSVYFLSEHQEASHQMMDVILSSNGFKTSDLILSDTASIPEDCDLLFIIQPQQDITKSESDILIDYLIMGGKLIVVNDYDTINVKYDNLNKVLQYMNISMTDSLIFENDPAYIYDMSNTLISRGVVSKEFSDLIDSISVTIGSSRNIEEYDNPNNQINIVSLIESSNSAVLETAGITDTSGATAGTHSAAMYSIRSGSNGNGELVVIGTQSLTGDGYYLSVGLNDINAEFIRGLAQKMTGEEIETSVESKEFPNYALTKMPTVSQSSFISVMLVAIIPLTLLVAAALVYNRRKHL